MTITELAKANGVQPPSIQRKIKRKNLGSFTITEQLPPEVVAQLVAPKPTDTKPAPAPVRSKPKQVSSTPSIQALRVNPPDSDTVKRPVNRWIAILPMLPLPMLGLAASYGVFFFAIQFVPLPIAIIEAAAFELVYIGLGSIRNPAPGQKRLIRTVSLAAVAVSVIYNTIAAGLHQNPELLKDLSFIWFWIISVVHGAPLAVLGYYVSVLNFTNHD